MPPLHPVLRSRWELTWRQLLDSTDWLGLPSSHDLDMGEALAATPLYRGTLACCGRGAFGFGASVQDTGPVSELRGLLRQWAVLAAGGGGGGARQEALAVQAFELALAHGAAERLQLGMPGQAFAFAVGGTGADVMVM
jgi:hypothetical protein